MKSFIRKIYNSLPLVREIRGLHRQTPCLEAISRSIQASHWQQLLNADPRLSEPKRLARFGYQVNSQNDEDGIIQEIFRRIGTSNRIFVEIGIGDGLENNTAFLYTLGWKGVWIDGNGAFLETLRSHGVPAERLKGRQAFVNRENVASLLAELGAPKEPDFLSLDIDQNTLHAWRGLKDYRPRVVAMEYNSVIPAEVPWEVEYHAERTWDGTQNFGASLKSFERVGREFGYSLVGCDFSGINAFFVRDDLVGEHFAAPFTAENHYEPPRYGLHPRMLHPRSLMHPIDLKQSP
ncbi:MAG: hypothetical protein QM755_20000 [Luteolibacter sp.]